MIPRAVVSKICPAQKPLVITRDNLTAVADHVQAVTRRTNPLNRCAYPATTQIPSSAARPRTRSVTRSSASQSNLPNPSKSTPAYPQRPLRKVRDPRPKPRRLLHLRTHPPGVLLGVCTHRKLTVATFKTVTTRFSMNRPPH